MADFKDELQCQPQDAELYAAVLAGDIEAARAAIEANGRINACAFLDDGNEGTALHCATRRCNEVMVDLLLEVGADVNLVDKDFHTPIELAAAQQNTSILGKLIASRKPFRQQKLVSLLVHCEERIREIPEELPFEQCFYELIGHYVNRIVGVDVSQLYGLDGGRYTRQRYLTHLEAITGQYEGESLEGWRAEEFLPLRILAHFETLIRLRLGQITDMNLETLSGDLELATDTTKVYVKEYLLQELLVELETLRHIRDRIAIEGIENKDSKGELHTHLANATIERIRELEIDQSCSIQTGYENQATGESHTIYINFTPKIDETSGDQYLQVRIDNLGKGCERHKIDPSDATQVKPFYYCTPSIDEIVDSVPEYIKNLTILLSVKDSNKSTLHDIIYDDLSYVRKSRIVEPEYTFPKQTGGHCVLANHQIGLTIRAGSAHLLEWLIDQETRRIKFQTEIELLKKGADADVWDTLSKTTDRSRIRTEILAGEPGSTAQMMETFVGRDAHRPATVVIDSEFEDNTLNITDEFNNDDKEIRAGADDIVRLHEGGALGTVLGESDTPVRTADDHEDRMPMSSLIIRKGASVRGSELNVSSRRNCKKLTLDLRNFDPSKPSGP